MYALLSTIQGMKSLPGRKAVIFVGDRLLAGDDQRMIDLSLSTPFDTLIDRQALGSALHTTVEMANRASVSIYIIAPTRLAWDRQSRNSPPFDGSEMEGRSRRALRRVAEETGGVAMFTHGDLESGLSQIVTDQNSFYVIGFTPPKSAFAKVSGKATFHDLKLTVSRPEAKVRTRAGFYGVTDRDVEGRNR